MGTLRPPEPVLIPPDRADEMAALLEAEDDLHLDLRAISFRYFFPGAGPRPRELRDQYEAAGSGTAGGEPDPRKAVELAFYADVTANGGISDARLLTAVERFATALAALEARLADGPYLMGGRETLLDIAWYIYCFRLVTSGYPLRERHPRLGAWFDGLHAREAFRREVAEPPPLVAMRKAMQAEQEARGTTLAQVAGL